MIIRAIHFLLDKINNDSLSKVGKEQYKKHVISEITKTRKEIILINGEIKRKRFICHVLLCYKTKAKEGTTLLMWITSSAVEIIHFEGTGLNGLCPNKSFILNSG